MEAANGNAHRMHGTATQESDNGVTHPLQGNATL